MSAHATAARPSAPKGFRQETISLINTALEAVAEYDNALGIETAKALRRTEPLLYSALTRIYVAGRAMSLAARARFLKRAKVTENGNVTNRWYALVTAFFGKTTHVSKPSLSKYAAIITYAESEKATPEQLVAFIKKHGGVEKTYVASRSKPKAKEEYDTHVAHTRAQHEWEELLAGLGQPKTTPIDDPKESAGLQEGAFHLVPRRYLDGQWFEYEPLDEEYSRKVLGRYVKLVRHAPV